MNQPTHVAPDWWAEVNRVVDTLADAFEQRSPGWKKRRRRYLSDHNTAPDKPNREPPVAVDTDAAAQRAIHYLTKEAPEAVEGAAGDETTLFVANKVLDYGVPESDAVDLMLDHWNERCQPPWAPDDLAVKVGNAARYRHSRIGSAAPEAQFEAVQPQAGAAGAEGETDDANAHPFDRLNRNYAFVLTGTGHHILWETTDERGRFALRHLSETSFHKAHAAQTMTIETQKGSKAVPVTKLWMEHERRRSYKGICFMPGRDAPSDWYNLWRGFTVEPLPEGEPATDEAAWALDAWLEHARENVCQGDRALFKWLIGFFAHMIQRPWEKPLVALVFRGGKGTGKNALVDRVGALLGSHYMLSSNRRYLVGNFNGHLERLLMFALDEAFWSGDKQAEGQLKDLITGRVHVIEHKGEEPYEVDNLTRVVIIGNEDWLVPATADERRFAVFDVGDGRKQDKRFFHRMRVAMERHGGYRLLLRYLLDLDISAIDVNQAPATQGLLDQKTQSLEPLQQWWLDCLLEGEVQGSDFAGGWPDSVETERLRAALRRYFRDRNVRARVPSAQGFGLELRRVAPGVKRKRIRQGDTLRYAYTMPLLDVAREEWDQYIGHKTDWPDEPE